jgi:hypothetical protein
MRNADSKAACILIVTLSILFAIKDIADLLNNHKSGPLPDSVLQIESTSLRRQASGERSQEPVGSNNSRKTASPPCFRGG